MAAKAFFGRVSHIYHEHPPVNWNNIKGELRPRNLPPTFEDLVQNKFHTALKNKDLQISLGLFSQTYAHFFRNADFDELFFIHHGKGKIETTYGPLDIQRGDYVIIPRGTTYKVFVQEPLKIFKIESQSEFEQPSRGLLGPNALYDQTVIETPQCAAGSDRDQGEYIVEI